jgi:hypothetical protein
MKQMSYKRGLEVLWKAHFTPGEIKRLCHVRRMYVENEQDQAPTNLSHLQFIRWLVKNGRLTEQCVED